MEGLVIIEGRKEYEEFSKHCIIVTRRGFDDVTYLGMIVMWVDDLKEVIKKLEKKG